MQAQCEPVRPDVQLHSRIRDNRRAPGVGDQPACRARGGFTLVEILAVIGLIALLVGLLLPALGAVRDQARNSQTRMLMKRISEAADAYQAATFRYPGSLTERQLASDYRYYEISSTENALLDLIGGRVSTRDGNQPSDDCFKIAGIEVDRHEIGQGRVVGTAQHPAYLQFDPGEFAYVNGQIGQEHVAENGIPDCGTKALPDIVDAWGTPVVFWRDSAAGSRSSPRGDYVVSYEATPMVRARFYWSVFQSYADSTELAVGGHGSRAEIINQYERSLLSTRHADTAEVIGRRLVEHPTEDGDVRNPFVIFSAGRDQVYFNAETEIDDALPVEQQLDAFDDLIHPVL